MEQPTELDARSVSQETEIASSPIPFTEQLKYLVVSLRPVQWIKNLFIFAALIFGGHLMDVGDLMTTALGFLSFSLVSSAVYLYNDISDIEQDRLHPTKSSRPLPAGLLSKALAAGAAAVLVVGGLIMAFALNLSFGIVVSLYVLINVSYSRGLKNVVILDVICIASGFVLRVIGGGVLIHVPISEWLILCTLLLSLFLGFSKRSTELVTVTGGSSQTRSVLGHYSAHFLDQMISIVTATTVMCYALYTISSQTVEKFGTRHLIYTVPFVLYGIFRYLYLTEKKAGGEDVAKTLLTDTSLIVNLFLWVAVATLIIYVRI